MTPNDDHVICPACVNQFRAIPVNVQRLMLDAGFEPPFTTPPAAQPPLPEQEPDELTIAYMSGLYDGKKKRPWVELTEAEIDYWLGCNTSKGAVARAIEKALKEKNI